MRRLAIDNCPVSEFGMFLIGRFCKWLRHVTVNPSIPYEKFDENLLWAPNTCSRLKSYHDYGTHCPACHVYLYMSWTSREEFEKGNLLAVCFLCKTPFVKPECPHCHAKCTMPFMKHHEGTDIICARCGNPFKLHFLEIWRRFRQEQILEICKEELMFGNYAIYSQCRYLLPEPPDLPPYLLPPKKQGLFQMK
eukprot:Phypoly_transcript_18017.p1 GENE.Phypoly_transcript_18017~~Phypoly_transcript_18017.p1  ORF type:complete len:201 (+),score=16.15 Phypoly_transcript_18017:26-604(+)